MSESLIKVIKNHSIVKSNELFNITQKLTKKQTDDLFLKAYYLILKAEKENVLDALQVVYFDWLKRASKSPVITREIVNTHSAKIFSALPLMFKDKNLGFIAANFDNYKELLLKTRLQHVDVPIDELLVDVKADTKDRVGEHASNMDDLKGRGSDKVKYLFASLQSEEKIYGLNRPANYTKCWNVVQGLLQNIVDLDEQIEILQANRTAYPFIDQLIDKLGIDSINPEYEDLKLEFFNCFSQNNNSFQLEEDNKDEKLFISLFFNTQIQNKIINDEIYFIDNMINSYSEFEFKNIDLSLLDNILILNPNHIPSLILKGFICYESRDWENTLDFINKTIRFIPNCSKLYLLKGYTNYKLKEYSNAIIDYSKAIEFDSNNDNCFFSRALANIKIDNLEEALIDIKKSIEINNQIHKYYCELGSVYNKLNKYDEAIESLNIAIKLSSCSTAFYNRGIAKQEIGDEEGAFNDKNMNNRLKNK